MSSGQCEYKREDCQADLCKVILGPDTNAALIARQVLSEHVELTGRTPHLVIRERLSVGLLVLSHALFVSFLNFRSKNSTILRSSVSHLHRSRLDPNRDLAEAAQGDQEATRAYHAFHGCIEHAHQALGGSPGLHLDFHGYRDRLKQNNTMIGYLFRKEELNEGIFNESTPSIQSLLDRTNIPVEEYLFGEKSLGSMFEKSGYRAVPSPRSVTSYNIFLFKNEL